MKNELWQFLKAADKPIVLYGMGNGADKIIKALNYYGIQFQGIFASDGFVREKLFHGYRIESYEELKKHFGEMIVLLCFGSSRPEVIKNILEIAAEQELYAPDVPVYGDGLFTAEHLKKYKESYKKVYSLLADEASRHTFECIINYKLSGKIDYLFECEVSPDEPYKSFLNLTDSENFLDLGAYRGDTVADFVSRVSGWQSITAVEPDIKTFKKLKTNTKHLKNIRLINACVSESCGTSQFAMHGGRNSSIGPGAEIPQLTVDSISDGKRVSFIKTDVEGEELKTISGMRETLLREKPKLLISCYHRTDDLISLPDAVFGIRGDYKLYMRHFRYIPAWDTNFYFV